jgi:hypothetical protein
MFVPGRPFWPRLTFVGKKGPGIVKRVFHLRGLGLTCEYWKGWKGLLETKLQTFVNYRRKKFNNIYG